MTSTTTPISQRTSRSDASGRDEDGGRNDDRRVAPEHADGGPRIDLDRSGTPEAIWLAAMADRPVLQIDDWDRLVVLAPHPDDETFGVGGTIARCARRGAQITVLAITDGDAAPGEAGDARTRRAEQAGALQALAPNALVRRLGLPDGDLGDRVDEIAGRLAPLVSRRDVVLAPYDRDGHPDHDATGEAARLVAAGCGATLWMYPVWAWHWHTLERSAMIRRSVRVEPGDAAMAAKHTAISHYRSQTAGPDPVVPAGMVERFRRSFETLVQP